jgi:hypothetical protein
MQLCQAPSRGAQLHVTVRVRKPKEEAAKRQKGLKETGGGISRKGEAGGMIAQ